MKCLCDLLGPGWERIGFGFYQSCRNRGSVGHVSVLRWCCRGEWVVGLCQGLGAWCLCVVSLDSLCR